jgi:hypothetical protein
MRTLLCTLGCVLALSALPLPAQEKAAPQLSSAEWLAKIQADKRGVVAKSMDLTADEAKKFWPLYDQFQRDLAVPQSMMNRAMLDYIAAGTTLTDANAKRLVEQIQRAAKDEARLSEQQFKQLLKVLPAHKAARYMQIENKIQAVVRYEAAKAMPLMN